jgi:hypothetical protein
MTLVLPVRSEGASSGQQAHRQGPSLDGLESGMGQVRAQDFPFAHVVRTTTHVHFLLHRVVQPGAHHLPALDRLVVRHGGPDLLPDPAHWMPLYIQGSGPAEQRVDHLFREPLVRHVIA